MAKIRNWLWNFFWKTIFSLFYWRGMTHVIWCGRHMSVADMVWVSCAMSSSPSPMLVSHTTSLSTIHLFLSTTLFTYFIIFFSLYVISYPWAFPCGRNIKVMWLQTHGTILCILEACDLVNLYTLPSPKWSLVVNYDEPSDFSKVKLYIKPRALCAPKYLNRRSRILPNHWISFRSFNSILTLKHFPLQNQSWPLILHSSQSLVILKDQIHFNVWALCTPKLP